jgi:formylglycine-generating enzyme required for sulfatase activity
MAFPEDLSPYGAFDLAGNAWEWTKDWYDPRYYQLSRTGSADNPSGPQNRPRSQQLVVKGGAKDWVVSKREGLKFDTRLPYLGFRGVLQVEGPGNAFEPPPSAAPAQPAAPGAPADGGSAVPF